MLALTRANLNDICSICLSDIRPTVFTQHVYDVKSEVGLSRLLNLTAHITVLKNPNNQSYIQEYCRKICEICYLKTKYSYYLREKIISSTIALKELLENEEMEDVDINRLQWFCRICLNRQKSQQEHTIMEHLKWMKDCTGIRFTSLRDTTERFRLKEGTNITEIMVVNDTQFPKQYCQSCLKKLKNMDEFRKLATQSFEYMISVMGLDGGEPPRNFDNKSETPEIEIIKKPNEVLNESNKDQQLYITENSIQLEDIKLEEEHVMCLEEYKDHSSDNDWEHVDDTRADYSDDEQDFTKPSAKVNHIDRDPFEKEFKIETSPMNFTRTQAKCKKWQDPKSIAPKDTIKGNKRKCVLRAKQLKQSEDQDLKNDNGNGDEIQDLKNISPEQILIENTKRIKKEDGDNENESHVPLTEETDVENIQSKNIVKRSRKSKQLKEKNKQNKTEIEFISVDDSKDHINLSQEEQSDPAAQEVKRPRKNRQQKDTNNKLPFKCEECPRKYSTEKSLNNHMLKHSGVDQSFHCENCNKTFRTIYILKRHQKEIHTKIEEINNDDGKSPPNTCDICAQTFKRKQHLVDHIKAVHEKVKPFKCSHCDKTFATSNNKRVHELSHTDTFPFVCDWCAKGFRQPSQLKIHLEIHTTKPELLCPICKRAQKSEEILKEHLKSHDEKRLQCPSCGKLFKSSCHLRDHQNAVHLKLRPFKCEYCDLAFGDRKTRRVHEKSHTEDRPEVCPICKRGFQNRNTLGRHMKEFGHLTDEFIKNNKKGKKKSQLAQSETIRVHEVHGLHYLLN